MTHYEEKIDQEINKINKILTFIRLEKENAPKGSLRISKSRNKIPRYYHIYTDESTGAIRDQYISKKKNRTLIERLAQKQYLKALEPVLEQELIHLKKLKDYYSQDRKGQVYDNLSEERKEMITPFFLSAEEKFLRWRNEKYPVNEEYAEYLRYETDRGELVRSKSELIIANLLYQEREHLHYRYEDVLELKKSRMTVHPDFTIMSKEKGTLIYWEHAGKVDDPRYSDEFVRKVNAYIKEDILPGKNLIITYETTAVPLNVDIVRRMIHRYF